MKNQFLVITLLSIILLAALISNQNINIDISITGMQTAAASCKNNNPEVSISPDKLQTVRQSGVLAYTVKIKNLDTQGCGDSTFWIFVELCDAEPSNVCGSSNIYGTVEKIPPSKTDGKRILLVHGKTKLGDYNFKFTVQSASFSDVKNITYIPFEVVGIGAISNEISHKIEVISPESGKTFVSTPILGWKSVPDAGCYEVVVREGDSTVPVIREIVYSTTFDIAKYRILKQGVKYTWDVVASASILNTCFGQIGRTTPTPWFTLDVKGETPPVPRDTPVSQPVVFQPPTGTTPSVVGQTSIKLGPGWNGMSVKQPMLGKTLADMSKNCGGPEGRRISRGWVYDDNKWFMLPGTDINDEEVKWFKGYKGGENYKERFEDRFFDDVLWIYVKLSETTCTLSCGRDSCE